MPRFVYEDFNVGVDLRGDPKGQYGTPRRQSGRRSPAYKRFTKFENLYITKGHTIRKRPGTHMLYQGLPLREEHKGLASLSNHIFAVTPSSAESDGTPVRAGTDADVFALSVGLSDGATGAPPRRILSMEIFSSGEVPGVYAVVEYTDQVVRHHYFALTDAGINSGGNAEPTNVLGLTLPSAQDRITLANLTPIHAPGQPLAIGKPVGSVVAQYPAADAELVENTNFIIWTAADPELAPGAALPAPMAEPVFLDSSPFADYRSPFTPGAGGDNDLTAENCSFEYHITSFSHELQEITKPAGARVHVMAIFGGEASYTSATEDTHDISEIVPSPTEGGEGTVFVVFEDGSSSVAYKLNYEIFSATTCTQFQSAPVLHCRQTTSTQYWRINGGNHSYRYLSGSQNRTAAATPVIPEFIGPLNTSESDSAKLNQTEISVSSRQARGVASHPYVAVKDVGFTHPAGPGPAGVRRVFITRPNGDSNLNLQNTAFDIGDSMLCERMLPPDIFTGTRWRVRNEDNSPSYVNQQIPLVENPQDDTRTYRDEVVHSFDVLMFLDNGNIIHRVVVLDGIA